MFNLTEATFPVILLQIQDLQVVRNLNNMGCMNGPIAVRGVVLESCAGDRSDYEFTSGGAAGCIIGKKVITCDDILRASAERIRWKQDLGASVCLITRAERESTYEVAVPAPKVRGKLAWTPFPMTDPGWYAERKKGWVRCG